MSLVLKFTRPRKLLTSVDSVVLVLVSMLRLSLPLDQCLVRCHSTKPINVNFGK